MFRIGVFELGLTCGLLFILIAIPIIVARYSARVEKRLKNIEKNIGEKKHS